MRILIADFVFKRLYVGLEVVGNCLHCILQGLKSNINFLLSFTSWISNNVHGFLQSAVCYGIIESINSILSRSLLVLIHSGRGIILKRHSILILRRLLKVTICKIFSSS